MIFDEKTGFNLTIHYLGEYIKNNDYPKYNSLKIYRWYQNYIQSQIEFNWLKDDELNKFDDFENLYDENPYKAKKRANLFIETLILKSKKRTFKLDGNSIFNKKLTAIKKLFQLSDLEISFIEITLLFELVDMFSEIFSIFELHCNENVAKLMVYKHCLQIDTQQYIEISNMNGKLIVKRLIECTPYHEEMVECGSLLITILNQSFNTESELKNIILEKPETSTLKWHDLEYIDNIEQTKDLFNQIYKKPTSGINILIYGETGVGKTEFAKVLCQTVQFELFSINNDMNIFQKHYYPSSHDRFDVLKIIQKILGQVSNTCILIDQASDIFEKNPVSEKYINKFDINIMLEKNPLPVIWIMDNIRNINVTHLRRFSHIIEISAPKEDTRRKIWQKSIDKYKFKLTAKQIDKLAKDYALTPAIIDSSVKITTMINGNINELEQHIYQFQKKLELSYQKTQDENN